MSVAVFNHSPTQSAVHLNTAAELAQKAQLLRQVLETAIHAISDGIAPRSDNKSVSMPNNARG